MIQGMGVIQPQRSVYGQVADDLRRRLAAGDPPSGELLPSENQLSARYGVSRGAINRAVLELRREGLVEVRRGVGTVACTPAETVTLPVEMVAGWAESLDEADDRSGRAGIVAASIRSAMSDGNGVGPPP